MLDKLIDFLLDVVGLFKFWEILDEYQQGVILRLGTHHRTVAGGLHWMLPFGIDRMIETATVVRTTDMRQAFLTLKDGTNVAISVVVRWRVHDVKKVLLEVWGFDDVIRDSVLGNVSTQVRKATWDEIQQPDFADKLTRESRKQAWRYGIEVEAVVLSDLIRTRALALLSGQPTNTLTSHNAT